MGASLHPPAGVHAQLVGLPVLAARSGSAVADPWRRLETLLAGLAAVALVLLVAFRGDTRRAFVPLAPIALATGWSALVLFVLRIPLNPMSVTLGALVIAISTEFSVLLSERHRQELAAGYDTLEALRRSYRRTGAAVAASGATAIFGFGVLALSDIRMLRDFGLVTLDGPHRLAAGRARGAARRAGARRARRRAGRCCPGGPAARGRTGRRAGARGPAMAGPEPPGAPSGRRGGGGREAARSLPPRRQAAAVRPLRRHCSRSRSSIGITINTITTKPNGASGVAAGERVPPFAVPLATGNLKGRRERLDEPAGRPACTVRGAADPQHLPALRTAGRSCSRCSSTPAAAPTSWATCRRSRPPTRRCSLRPSRSGRTAVRCASCCPRTALTFPVGIDDQGDLAALYKIATCPQVTFIERGGAAQGHALLGRPSRGDAALAPRRARSGRGERVRPPRDRETRGPSGEGRDRARRPGRRLARDPRSSRSCPACSCSTARSRWSAPSR